MFSAGLDVPALLQLKRDDFRVFWNDFFGLCAALARSSIPIVAAITGHAPAGGAVLSIMCDYRVMADGAFKIGLNETQVGLAVPECIQAALRRLVGTYRAERLMVAGAMLDAADAKAIGFVDELVATDLVVPRAIAWMSELLRLPPVAMSETRRLARADLAAVFADPTALPVEDFLDRWFAPEAQAVLQALVARLKSKAEARLHGTCRRVHFSGAHRASTHLGECAGKPGSRRFCETRPVGCPLPTETAYMDRHASPPRASRP